MSDVPPMVLKSEVLVLGALTGAIDLIVTIGREAGLPATRVLALLEGLAERYERTLEDGPGKTFLLEAIAQAQAALPPNP